MKHSRVEHHSALIVDDEPLARKGIRRLLKLHPQFQQVEECGDGLEAVARIRERAPDIIFLDIQMPGLDGFGVIESIGAANMPGVIFITAFDDHALKAFKVHAVDYLLKPVKAAAFDIAVERALAIGAEGRTKQHLKKLESLLSSIAETRTPQQLYTERFLIRMHGKTIVVPAGEIAWCEAKDDYVQFHTSEYGRGHNTAAPLLLRGTMNSVETRLDPSAFVRIHRTYLVRIECIRQMKTLTNGDLLVVLGDGTELPMSRTYRTKAMEVIEGHSS